MAHWIKGSTKPIRVVALDWITSVGRLEGKTVIKVKGLPEEKNEVSSMP